MSFKCCLKISLQRKCPNAEFFLVRIFLYSDWTRRFTQSPYSVRIHENMDQKKLRIWTLFTQCIHKINIEIKHQNRPRKPDKNRLLMAKLSKVTRSGMEAIVYSVFGNMLTLCCYWECKILKLGQDKFQKKVNLPIFHILYVVVHVHWSSPYPQPVFIQPPNSLFTVPQNVITNATITDIPSEASKHKISNIRKNTI